MRRYSIPDFITKRIIKDIQDSISTGSTINARVDSYKKRFNTFSPNVQVELIKRIVNSQSRAVKYGMENRMDIKLISIGRFSAKNTRQIVLDIKREVLDELGIIDYHSAGEDVHEQVEAIVNERKTIAFKKLKVEKGYVHKQAVRDVPVRRSNKVNPTVLKHSLFTKKVNKQ